MNTKEKLVVLNEGIYYLYNIIKKMELDEELPSLTMFLLGEHSEIYDKIKELEEDENGNSSIDNR